MRKLISVLFLSFCSFASMSQTNVSAVNSLYGKWKYVEATLIEPNNKETSVKLEGVFMVLKNGTYEMARYIGGVGAFPKGKYVLKGKILTLYNSGIIADVVNYSWGFHKDRHGNSFEALLLKSRSQDGTVTIYTLTR